MIPLNRLQPGGRASLAQVGGARGFRRRLMEMGLLPGTPVRLVRQVGIGDLLEVEVRGSHVSLRNADAARILVHPEGA
jgi:Fe2+ transport system protein FeoA